MAWQVALMPRRRDGRHHGYRGGKGGIVYADQYLEHDKKDQPSTPRPIEVARIRPSKDMSQAAEMLFKRYSAASLDAQGVLW